MISKQCQACFASWLSMLSWMPRDFLATSWQKHDPSPFTRRTTCLKQKSQLPSRHSPNGWDAVSNYGTPPNTSGKAVKQAGLSQYTKVQLSSNPLFSASICPFWSQALMLRAPGKESSHRIANGWLQKRRWLWDPAAAMPVRYFGTDLWQVCLRFH